MSFKSRLVTGVILIVVGLVLMAGGAWRMFAEGVRADAAGDAGVFSPFDLAMGIGGLGAFLTGIMIVLFAVAGRGEERP